MKLFLKKLTIFVLPLSILFIFPATVLIYGREYFSYEQVLETQSRFPESLFGFAYNGASFYPYKEALVTRENGEVIALGSSRVMQLRKEFFTDEASFVNAGGAGKTLREVESFIESLPDNSRTKVIILGLESEYFTDPYPRKEDRHEYVLPLRFVMLNVLMSRRIYLDYINHKYSLRDIIKNANDSHHIGLSALLHQDGFRSDGSYKYSAAEKNPNRLSYVDGQVRVALEDFRRKGGSFDMSGPAIESNIEILERILHLAKKKGITIVGFTPPVPSLVHKVTMEDATLRNLTERVGVSFKSHGMPFFNVSDIKVFGGKDTEFVDVVHGTDYLYGKMLFYMASKTTILEQYVPLKNLRSILDQTKGNFLNF